MVAEDWVGAVVAGVFAGAELAAVAFADDVADAELPALLFVLFLLFFFFVVAEGVVAAGDDAAGAGVAGVVAGAVELCAGELEVTAAGAAGVPLGAKPPLLPNCGGVIETTAPKPPMVPPTMSANLLESMELELLCMYPYLWDASVFCRAENSFYQRCWTADIDF